MADPETSGFGVNAADDLSRRTYLVRLERAAARLGVTPERLRDELAVNNLVALYANDVQEMGERAGWCTWDRTFQVCPYCQCHRKPAEAVNG